MIRQMISIILVAWAVVGCANHSQKIKGGQVYLHLNDTSSRSAFFASSLDGFQRHPLTRQTKKTWLVTLPADREFTYFYIMDGQPFVPDCHYKEKDDYGSENCIFMPDM